MDEINSNSNAISNVRTERSYRTCSPFRGASGGTLMAELQIQSNDCQNHNGLGVLQDYAPTEPENNAHAVAQDRAGRKMLTVRKRLLVFDIKSLNNALKSCYNHQKLSEQISKCVDLRLAYSKFRESLDDITDPVWICELTDGVCDKFDKCMDLFDKLESEYLVEASKPSVSKSYGDGKFNEKDIIDCDVEPTDSVSQVSAEVSNFSRVSNRSTMRQIEIDKKRADLKISHELQVQKTKIQIKAQIEEAEVLAKMRLEEAALDAEEKLRSCSELGSSITSSRNFRSHRSKMSINIGTNIHQTKEPKTIKLFNSPDTKLPGSADSFKVTNTEKVPLLNTALSCQSCNKTQAEADRTKNKVEDKQCKTALNPTAKEFTHSSILSTAKGNYINSAKTRDTVSHYQSNVPVTPLLSESPILQTYLDGQGRNEYVSLASQIAYDGVNLAFVFYENQIRRLMDESPYPERRFEVLRASCVGQSREMVNFFLLP